MRHSGPPSMNCSAVVAVKHRGPSARCIGFLLSQGVRRSLATLVQFGRISVGQRLNYRFGSNDDCTPGRYIEPLVVAGRRIADQ